MKIVFFIHSMSLGGAERVTATLANYWATQGRDIVVVTMSDFAEQEYALDPAVQRICLNLANDSANPGRAAWNNFQRVSAIRRILISERPDVSIGMMSTASILLALAAIGTGSVTVGTERVHPPTAGLTRLWGAFRRVTYGWLRIVVTQTQGSADWIAKNTSARRACVIPNPIRLPLPKSRPIITPAEILGSTNRGRLLLCVGRLVNQKRFDRAICAFARLAERHPEWRLAIIGEGPTRNALIDLAKRLNIDSRLCLPGVVGNLSEWYDAADLFALTSDFEGFPNTLLEAMAHGVASVSVDCETGPRDLINHEVDGLLVPLTDDAALHATLDRCMSDHDLRRRLGQSALQVRERYDLARIAGLWDAEFVRLSSP